MSPEDREAVFQSAKARAARYKRKDGWLDEEVRQWLIDDYWRPRILNDSQCREIMESVKDIHYDNEGIDWVAKLQETFAKKNQPPRACN